jgi:hypothetical protein
MHLLGARFIGWLLLPPLVAHDSLIGAVWGFRWKLWHALLATVFSTLILHTFEIVFLGHHASLVLLSIRRLWSRGSCCLVVSKPEGAGPQLLLFPRHADLEFADSMSPAGSMPGSVSAFQRGKTKNPPGGERGAG